MRVVAVCDRAFDDEGTFAEGIRYYRAHRRLLTDDLDVLLV